MEKKKKTGILLYVLSGALALGSGACLAVYGAFRWALWRAGHPGAGMASSVGVIGGADGPTAILVTAGPGPGMGTFLLLGGLLAGAAAAAFFLGRHLRRKQG